MTGHSDTYGSNFRHKTKMVEKTFSNSPSSVILHHRTRSFVQILFAAASRTIEFNKFLVNAFLTLFDARENYKPDPPRARLPFEVLILTVPTVLIFASLLPILTVPTQFASSSDLSSIIGSFDIFDCLPNYNCSFSLAT